MADEHPAESPQDGSQGSQDPGKPLGEEKVPWERFEDVNQRAKRAEKELEDLRLRIVDFEERDKSETERAQARAQRAEQTAAQLQNTVTTLQKGSWVRSAATELGFHDPEDAVAHLHDQLARLDDERDARRQVKSLAQAKKHLVRDDDAKKNERPRIGRVFAGDERQTRSDQRPLSREQVAAAQEMNFAQGLAEDLDRVRSSWREMGGGIT